MSGLLLSSCIKDTKRFFMRSYYTQKKKNRWLPFNFFMECFVKLLFITHFLEIHTLESSRSFSMLTTGGAFKVFFSKALHFQLIQCSCSLANRSDCGYTGQLQNGNVWSRAVSKEPNHPTCLCFGEKNLINHYAKRVQNFQKLLAYK